ncbi:response regulator transcription factor [Methylocystis heyeri]|uniref:Response regulator n=1 Tax=Methylocystis heyeri TaxID=391905 RepID=A0A6B8K807_9HYPH|nr:response regulator transcription factor [Methylocystis heyeri]QGM44344.1 response regulator [Methylocystis heyeri]
MRILLVEDEPDMARLVRALVSGAGFVVDHAGGLGEAHEAARQYNYDLLLLDRRLPDGDGLSLLPIVRAMSPGVRVMMLTALDELNDRVMGLDAGADDYLTKPFQGEELIARIRACLRRPGGAPLPPLVVGLLSLDIATREVSVAGRPVALNRRELMLLQAMMRRASRVTTREALLEEVYSLLDEVQANTLDTLVSRLRRRLAELDSGVAIHTVRGIGYILTEQAS